MFYFDSTLGSYTSVRSSVYIATRVFNWTYGIYSPPLSHVTCLFNITFSPIYPYLYLPCSSPSTPCLPHFSFLFLSYSLSLSPTPSFSPSLSPSHPHACLPPFSFLFIPPPPPPPPPSLSLIYTSRKASA